MGRKAGARCQGCSARLASSPLEDPLHMGSSPCMFSACSFEVLADVSGHDRPGFAFLPSGSQGQSPTSSWPWGVVCAMEVEAKEVSTWQIHMSEVWTGCEAIGNGGVCGELGNTWAIKRAQVPLNSVSVTIWEFRPGATRSVDSFKRSWESRFLYEISGF